MPPKAHIAQVVVRGKLQGQDYRNVMHFGTDLTGWDTETDTLLLALAAAMMQCWVTVLLPGLGSQFQLQGVTAQRIYPSKSDTVMAVAGAGPGALTGQMLPSYVSRQADVKTGGGGRKNRGRLFLPPPLEGEQEDSYQTTDSVALVAAFLACVAGKFLGATPTEDWNFGVLSRARIAAGEAINVAFKDATSLTALSLLAVQRRRKIGSGS